MAIFIGLLLGVNTNKVLFFSCLCLGIFASCLASYQPEYYHQPEIVHFGNSLSPPLYEKQYLLCVPVPTELTHPGAFPYGTPGVNAGVIDIMRQPEQGGTVIIENRGVSLQGIYSLFTTEGVQLPENDYDAFEFCYYSEKFV